MKKLTYLLTLILFMAASTLAAGSVPALAQAEVTCETDVIVQADDWLSKIAQKFYNDVLAFPAIVEATNAKAATDNSYAMIANPDLIEPGWKLCLPDAATAQAMLGQADQSTAMAETPVAEAPAAAAAMSDSAVQITLLHLNDIYEITPVSGGAEGGLARVATLRRQLLAENPNTFTLLAGDLFSPSAIGTAMVGGERLSGKQTVGVMNTVGLDFMTFGNHEFDLSEEQFLQRLAESDFTWVSSNVFDANQQPFPGVAKNHVFTITGERGQEARIGIFGLTIASNPKPYVVYTDPFAAAAEQVQELRSQVDILIALTHLAMPDDMKLAGQFPEIDLVIGGHEHENMSEWAGPGFAPIYKADANARTAYIHRLSYDPATSELQINSQLQPVTAAIPDDPETLQVVNDWVNLAFEGFRQDGFNPEQMVAEVPIPLDGLEASVRNRPTDLTQIIAEGTLSAAPGTELAIYNGGSIRIDDTIPPGPITEYDVIRILPFGGKVMSVEMKGNLLQQVLEQGQANQGNGGYLQTANVSRDEASGAWLINDEPLDPERSYMVAINDFLLTGREQNLGFLNETNEELQVVGEHADIRQAMIEQLRREFPTN
jgi:5'-nucleotidase